MMKLIAIAAGLWLVPAAPAATNYVVNGNFSAGLAGWTTVTVVEYPIMGSVYPKFAVQADQGPCDPQPGNPRLYLDVPVFAVGYAAQEIALPPSATTLTFRSWGNDDPVSVTVSIETISDGIVYDLDAYTPPAVEAGSSVCSGNPPVTKSYDLAAFAGKTVSLRLRAESGPGLFNGTIASFDDVSILPSGAAAVDSGDYDGDGTADVALFRGPSGMWSVRNLTRAYFGGAADHLVPADYDGDGTTDIAVFRGTGGMWSVRNLTRFYLGTLDDQPAPGDYDGDGGAEAGVFRPSSSLWSVRDVTRANFGSAEDTAIPGFYGGDGAKRLAVFRPSSGMWSVRGLTRFYFGASGDDLVPGDYSGAGGWEAGIFRADSSLWSIRGLTRIYLGIAGDWVLPADYDGDGADEAGIFRGAAGIWSLREVTRAYFGSSSDVPVTR